METMPWLAIGAVIAFIVLSTWLIGKLEKQEGKIGHPCPVCGRMFYYEGKDKTGYPNLVFLGWIRAKKKDRRILRQLGVFGPMHWTTNHFNHCYATAEVLVRLIREWKLPNPGSFTAVDKKGNDLPQREQHMWYKRWEKIQTEVAEGI